jgi:hypothetical protein
VEAEDDDEGLSSFFLDTADNVIEFRVFGATAIVVAGMKNEYPICVLILVPEPPQSAPQD